LDYGNLRLLVSPRLLGLRLYFGHIEMCLHNFGASLLQFVRPFRYFKTNPKIIQLAVMLYVRFPLSSFDVSILRKAVVLLLLIGGALLNTCFSKKDDRAEDRKSRIGV